VSKKRSERAIMGVSIGGMGALRIAFKFPERFGVVAAHSAAMFPADPKDIGDGRSRRMIEGQIRAMGWQELLGDPIDPKKWAKLIPTAMAATMKPADFKGLRIYFDAGSADRYGFGPPNVALHEQLEKQGIAHSFHYFDGGGHAWGTGSTQRALVDSLAFVGATFEKSAEATAKSAAHDGGK
jgi:S-formylglutathione hydrolase